MAWGTRTTRRANLRSLRPPVLAVWLFQHLTRREHREALAGDLLEEYSRRQSDAWFWRQVFAAVAVDFRTELRSRWVGVIFALVVCGSIPLKQLFLNARFQSFLFSGIQLNWPASFVAGIAMVFAFHGAVLLAALIVYVLSANCFQPRSFLISFASALLVLAIGDTVVVTSQVLPWPRMFFYFVIWRLPLFFSLVLSIRVVSTHRLRGAHLEA
jgi:hypothetical protein